MGTKSKKFKPLIIWICFFLGISIMVSFISGAQYVLRVDYDGVTTEIRDAFKSNMRDTLQFKHNISLMYNMLAETLTGKYNGDRVDEIESSLGKEGINLVYYGENTETGMMLTNYENDLGFGGDGFPRLPAGYSYYLYFDGKRITVKDSGKTLDVNDDGMGNAGYLALKMRGYLSKDMEKTNPLLSKCRILLAVKDKPVKVTGINGRIYNIGRQKNLLKYFILFLGFTLAVGLALIVLSIKYRKAKLMVDKRIGLIMGKIWLEFKMIPGILLFFSLYIMASPYKRTHFLQSGFIALVVTWSVYLIGVDLWYNGKKVFTHSLMGKAGGIYRSYERKKPFQKGMLTRLYVFIGGEILLVFLMALSIIFIPSRNMIGIFFFFIFLCAGIYLMVLYIRKYRETVGDVGILADRIEAIKDGRKINDPELKPGADLCKTYESLNMIREGIEKAVEERIKSERTKMELITNVSHDLKTPLTSIISYVDLLSKEEDLPNHVKEYIKILSNKSDRLKLLISDLFDLAKAASGEINRDFEKLDLGKLILQTLADMDDQITRSPLSFKINVPKEPVHIFSDGKKLYRVFQNLISNALKYSLAGSRVYIDLLNHGGYCEIIIKNIAGYEMNFDEGMVMERFVRGDKARSGDGSGLGLAIAGSFTHVCEGTFLVKIDGDMFKVILTFDISKE